jgi:hypothetical protein
MRGRLAVLLLLLLASCGEVDGDPAAAAFGVTARFDPDGLADVIVVSAVDWRPLRGAVLVGREGERVPAYSLDVVASPVQSDPLAIEMMMNTPGAARSVSRLKAMVSSALIRLPDPARYGKTWQSLRVEIVLGDAGSGREVFTVAAPAPL